MLGKNGNITKEDITETPEGMSKVVTQNGQQKIYDYDAAKGWVEAKPVETAPKKEEIPKTEFKEVFEKSGKKATIDETGSTQRLTRIMSGQPMLLFLNVQTMTETVYLKKLLLL
ncbi:MAG: hypothetical protein ACLSA2_06350 [Candidatus Gastranaerophilaceae bacterium]